MQALRPIRKEKSSCRSGGNVRWRFRKNLAGLPLQQTLIGECTHQRHQIFDLLICQIQFAHVFAIDGLGIVRCPPTFEFHIPLVVKLHHLLQGRNRPVVHVRPGQFDVPQGWCAKLPHGLDAHSFTQSWILSALGRDTKIVITKIAQQSRCPTGWFKKVTVCTLPSPSKHFQPPKFGS